MHTQLKWQPRNTLGVSFTSAALAPSVSGQRLLDVATQWRTLATATQVDALRPLFLNAARALEMQAIDEVPRCSCCLKPLIAHLEPCSAKPRASRSERPAMQ
jgi:hypothetical protein